MCPSEGSAVPAESSFTPHSNFWMVEVTVNESKLSDCTGELMKVCKHKVLTNAQRNTERLKRQV